MLHESGDVPISRPPLRIGVDFEVTLDGVPVDGVIAATSTNDANGVFGWVETDAGVHYGHVEFRMIRCAKEQPDVRI